jgi:hypothetical protein
MVDVSYHVCWRPLEGGERTGPKVAFFRSLFDASRRTHKPFSNLWFYRGLWSCVFGTMLQRDSFSVILGAV